MIITRAKIWEVCRTDDTFPVLTGVFYDAEKKRLAAADGFIAAVCPIIDEEPLPKFNRIIPVEAIKHAQKLAGVTGTPNLALFKQYCETTDGRVYSYVCNGTTPIESFPNIDQVTPGKEGLDFVCALDADRLIRLARAICEFPEGSTRNFLRFVQVWRNHQVPTAPLHFVPQSAGNIANYGLLMPVEGVDLPKTQDEMMTEIMGVGYTVEMDCRSKQYMVFLHPKRNHLPEYETQRYKTILQAVTEAYNFLKERESVK